MLKFTMKMISRPLNFFDSEPGRTSGIYPAQKKMRRESQKSTVRGVVSGRIGARYRSGITACTMEGGTGIYREMLENSWWLFYETLIASFSPISCGLASILCVFSYYCYLTRCPTSCLTCSYGLKLKDVTLNH